MAKLTLTKEQTQTNIGAELLSLCQTMTADGRLLDQEIIGLKEWLKAHRDADLPGIDFLGNIIEAALADGKISDEERRTIHAAIEKLLPPDLRMIAQMHRREAKAEDKELLKQQKQEEKERNAPLDAWNFMVAGTRYDGRSALIDRFLSGGDEVLFRREPFNPHSPRAIAIFTKKQKAMIGYVPEDRNIAKDMASLLDNGTNYTAVVTKIIGYKSSIPIVDAKFYKKDAAVANINAPLPPKAQETSSRAWGYAIAALLILYWIFK